jgi:hypothetical protein
MRVHLTFLIVIVLHYQSLAQNTLVLQPGALEGKDAMIGHTPTMNFGTQPDLICNTWTCGGQLCVWRSLIEFDLSSIPTGAQIQSALLYFYAQTNTTQSGGNPTTGNDNKGWFRRLLEPWGEMTVTWNNQPAYTTMNQVELPASVSNAQDYVLDVKQLIIDVLQNNNYGFVLMQQDEVNFYKSLCFSSSDDPNSARHPKLVIEFKVDHVGINSLPSTASFNLFQKNNNVYLIQASNLSQPLFELCVYNSVGELMMQERINQSTASVDFNNLPAGMYLIKCNELNSSNTFKVVKL